MSAVPVDLTVSCRWILPMTAPHAVLENHAVVVRDGRICDLLPADEAAARYIPAVHVDRPEHLVLPGLVNACTRIVPPPGRALSPDRLDDGALLCIAEILEAGTTCFCSLGYFPQESARAAAAQGLRAVIGIPIAEAASPWAASPGEYLTRALNFRDEYRGHPTIATVFAPQSPVDVSDAVFARIATLADELDAGIVAPLHESRAEVDECVIRHGVRPIQRLHALGLLTPALTAVHMAVADAADRELAQRGGIGIVLCPESSLRAGNGLPPLASWAASGLRLGLASGSGETAGNMELWTAVRILALLATASDSSSARAVLSDGACAAYAAPSAAWDALAVATRGGAAALGLDAEIGTLEKGKWADMCCIDLRRPAAQWISRAAPGDAALGLARVGGRDLVSDVWVSGRQLVDSRTFTRLDWPRAAARVNGRRMSPLIGDSI